MQYKYKHTEQVHVYWTIMDIYNIFLTALFFGKIITDTN